MINANRKHLDTSFWREVCERFGNRQHFSLGDYFVHSGEKMSFIGWIMSGSFKYSLPVSNGNDKTIGFAISNSMLADYGSVMQSRKMPTDVIALEDSEVIIAPYKAMYDWLMGDPTLHIQFIQLMFEQSYELTLDFYRYTPKQRFKILLERWPQIIKIVPVGDIASYLNISQRQFQRLIPKNFHQEC